MFWHDSKAVPLRHANFKGDLLFKILNFQFEVEKDEPRELFNFITRHNSWWFYFFKLFKTQLKLFKKPFFISSWFFLNPKPVPFPACLMSQDNFTIFPSDIEQVKLRLISCEIKNVLKLSFIAMKALTPRRKMFQQEIKLQ